MFLTLPLIFYLNKKNKAFWCGLGQLVAALANLLPLLAWLAVPGSYVTTDIIAQGEQVELCQERGEILLQAQIFIVFTLKIATFALNLALKSLNCHCHYLKEYLQMARGMKARTR